MIKKYWLLLLSLNISIAVFPQLIVSVPMEMNRELTFIKVQVNGSDTLNFLFDTGASGTLIDSDAYSRIQLNTTGSSVNIGASGARPVTSSKGNILSIGGFKLKGFPLYGTSLAHMDAAFGKRVDGIIGYDIFCNYVVEVDHVNLKFNLYKNINTDIVNGAFKLKLKSIEKKMVCQALLTIADGTTIPANLMIDSGSLSDLRLYSPFVKRWNLVDSTKIYEYVYESGSTADIMKSPVEHFRSVSFGEIIVNLPSVVLCSENDRSYAHKKIHGLIGNQILRQFTLVIDEQHNALYLRKGK